MDLLHPRCAGLDIHKKTVVAAVRIVEAQKVHRVLRTFGTTTAQLFELAEFLSEHSSSYAAPLIPLATAHRSEFSGLGLPSTGYRGWDLLHRHGASQRSLTCHPAP